MSSTEWKAASPTSCGPRTCRKCGGTNVEVRTVTSFDEAYDDDNFRCLDCKHNWWVDGPDA